MMAATLRIGNLEATIDGYVWTGEPVLARALNAMLDPDGPAGSDPNPDHTAALLMARQFGGEVVRFDKADYVEGRVY